MFIVFLSLEHSKRGKKKKKKNRDTVYLGCWDATSVTVKCISLQTDDICQFPVRISPERSKGNTMIASVISIRGRRDRLKQQARLNMMYDSFLICLDMLAF